MAQIEISSHGFCESLPEELCGIVDMMTPHFLAEDWPVRFVALMSMLEDMTAQVQPAHRPFIVNDWVIVVSGLLERLPRDLSSPECLTLMRHSVLESFRQSAVRYTSDVN